MGKYKPNQLVILNGTRSYARILEEARSDRYVIDYGPRDNLWCEDMFEPLKLIDVLNLISEDKLKEGTKIATNNTVYIFDGKNIRRLNVEKRNILLAIYDFTELNDEVEVYAPGSNAGTKWEPKVEFIDFSDMDMNSFPKVEMQESSKIEELTSNELLNADGSISRFYILLDKLNEVIRKVNGD